MTWIQSNDIFSYFSFGNYRDEWKKKRNQYIVLIWVVTYKRTNRILFPFPAHERFSTTHKISTQFTGKKTALPPIFLEVVLAKIPEKVESCTSNANGSNFKFNINETFVIVSHFCCLKHFVCLWSTTTTTTVQ